MSKTKAAQSDKPFRQTGKLSLPKVAGAAQSTTAKQQPVPAGWVKPDALTLSPGEASSLQRTIGNMSLGQVIQRGKSEEARGEKHRRIEMANKAIPFLQSKVSSKLQDHLFDAKPITNKPINKDDPTGLHAYRDGKLPGGVEIVETQGSTGKVHGIKWRWNGSAKEKKSTMFPDWMPDKHVNALIALQDGSVGAELSKMDVVSEKVKTHILHGQDITIKSSGETTYPSRPDLDTWIKT